MPHPIRLLVTVAAGAAASLALASPAAAQEPAITPALNCVQRLDTTPELPAPRFRAHFSYTSTFAAEEIIERGERNNVVRELGDPTPDAKDLTYGTKFGPGTHPGNFSAEFDGAFATWNVASTPGVVKSATATTAYADRCVWDDVKAVPTSDGASIGWTFSVSGQGHDGLGHADWEDYRNQECLLDGVKLPDSRCLIDPKTEKITLTGLAPSSTHEFTVRALAPKLCETASDNGDGCLPYFAPSVDLDPARDTTHMVDETVRFTVLAAPPREEPKAELPPTPPVQKPQPPATQPTQTRPTPTTPPPAIVRPPVVITEPQVDPPCAKRSLRITVPRRRGQSIRWASVRVDDSRLKLRRSRGRLVATLAARRITSETVTVSIKVRYSNGKRRTITQTVNTCA